MFQPISPKFNAVPLVVATVVSFALAVAPQTGPPKSLGGRVAVITDPPDPTVNVVGKSCTVILSPSSAASPTSLICDSKIPRNEHGLSSAGWRLRRSVFPPAFEIVPVYGAV